MSKLSDLVQALAVMREQTVTNDSFLASILVQISPRGFRYTAASKAAGLEHVRVMLLELAIPELRAMGASVEGYEAELQDAMLVLQRREAAVLNIQLNLENSIAAGVCPECEDDETLLQRPPREDLN